MDDVARERGPHPRGRGRASRAAADAAVGLAVSGGALALAVAVALGGLALLPAPPGAAGLVPSRGHDSSVPALSAEEQAFIDGLYDATHTAHDDAALLAMGRGFCDDLDAGASPPRADAALVERWAGAPLDLDAAYDVEWEATSSLCPAHAEVFRAWDPTVTDPLADEPSDLLTA